MCSLHDWLFQLRRHYYLNFAKEVYNWMTAYLCDISTGQVYDNLSIKDDGTPGIGCHALFYEKSLDTLLFGAFSLALRENVL